MPSHPSFLLLTLSHSLFHSLSLSLSLYLCLSLTGEEGVRTIDLKFFQIYDLNRLKCFWKGPCFIMGKLLPNNEQTLQLHGQTNGTYRTFHFYGAHPVQWSERERVIVSCMCKQKVRACSKPRTNFFTPRACSKSFPFSQSVSMCDYIKYISFENCWIKCENNMQFGDNTI